MTIRTRFAPSPTGDLHIGSARTALFSWLYARRHGGQFILRIEDTDQERSTQASALGILESMAWLGLDYDEGPFYQSQRFERYQAVLDELLASNHAYRCYCSKERLEALREEQINHKQKPRYDGHCRHKQGGEGTFVLRLRNPEQGAVTFMDEVHGSITTQNAELDDLILARSDGVPTYNFTVVVDDIDMKISHVIRGDDHINNTPRQINIFNALGIQPPSYTHVPMILGEDGKRLSKRYGATHVMQYREEGFLPDALLNYLVRLGWSHGDQEIFSRDEMIALFDTNHLNKAAAALNIEKLRWLNQHYLKTSPPAKIVKELAWHFQRQGIDVNQGPHLEDILALQCDRAKTLKEMVEASAYFYQDKISYDEKAVAKHLSADILPALKEVQKKLALLKEGKELSAFKKILKFLKLLKLKNWNNENIHAAIVEAAKEFDWGIGKLAQPLRVAVTGGTVSPPIDATLRVLGKQVVLTRISNVINKMIAEKEVPISPTTPERRVPHFAPSAALNHRETQNPQFH